MKNRKLQRDYSTLDNACRCASKTESAVIENLNDSENISAEEFFIMDNALKMANRNNMKRKSALKTIRKLIKKATPQKLTAEITRIPDTTPSHPRYIIEARCPDCGMMMITFTYAPEECGKNYFFGNGPDKSFDIVSYMKDREQIQFYQYCRRCGKKFKWKKR